MAVTADATLMAPGGLQEPGIAWTDRTRAYQRLWLVVCALVATLHVTAAFMTQSAVAGLLAITVWGGAFICLEDRVPDTRPAPSAAGFALGFALVAASIWRTAVLTHWDIVFYGIPIVAGLGLALLYLPWSRLPAFKDGLVSLFLLLPAIAFFRLLPEEPLSLATAKITKLALMALGMHAQVQGRQVLLDGGGVSIQGPCSGVEQVAQLLLIAVVFLMAFRMRSVWRMVCVLVASVVLAVLGNAVRIAFLAVITASDWSFKHAWFRFFHDDTGSLIFAGLTVAVFGWVYLRVLEPELAPVRVEGDLRV